MTDDQARDVVLEALAEIAPEADTATLDPDADLGETLDLDSMDLFNLVAAVSERTGIDIPDSDTPRLRSLNGAVAYLSGRST